jgi:5-methylcytosine-specific restriction endonuclease McrA
MNTTRDKICTMQENIRTIDNSTLHHAISSWQSKERRCQLLVLIHLAEIEQRRLYLDLGYMHLGDYCQSYLGLSDNESWLRVYVARAGLRYPSLLVALVDGSISLTVAGMLARHLRDDNVEVLLQSCCGKSKREVEEFLAARGAGPALNRSSLRPILVSLAKVDASSPTQLSGVEHPRELALEASLKEPLPAVEKESNTKLVHRLSCTISDEAKEKLLRLAEVLGIVDPIANLDLVITKAADLALRAKDPATRSTTPATLVKNRSPEASPTSIARPRSRYIAAAVRRELLARAGYRCEFNGPEGKRCRQRTDLEIDHIHAFSWGGSNVISNLQVLCSSHNRRKYERERERTSLRLSG